MLARAAGITSILFLYSVSSAFQARASSESVIYSFKGGNDGEAPIAGLISVAGKLYGTTAGGGGKGCGGNGCGTVFASTPAGAEHVLHVFKGGADGAAPNAPVIEAKSLLYGTTTAGGGYPCHSSSGDGDCGTVFSLTLAGKEAVLHAFGKGKDGATPGGPLIYTGGALFGTTQGGGVAGNGVVFKLGLGGKEAIIHSFTGGPSDGAEPNGGVVNVKGTLFGTTATGGKNSCADGDSCGTVFSISPSYEENVLYSFQGGKDGFDPNAALINVGGLLYGTTFLGGFVPGAGYGTVFAVTQSGAEVALHRFGTDGVEPLAPLLDFRDEFYGTTPYGGDYAQGEIYKVTAAGHFTVLYSFKGGADGAYPTCGLLNVGGVLYGTTSFGGAHGVGTIFKYVP